MIGPPPKMPETPQWLFYLFLVPMSIPLLIAGFFHPLILGTVLFGIAMSWLLVDKYLLPGPAN